MTQIYFVIVGWCVGVLISFMLGSALWWVSALGVLPLMAGLYVGYATGVRVTTQHYRRMMRNREPN